MKEKRPCCETCAHRGECDAMRESEAEGEVAYYCTLYRREGQPIRARAKNDDEWEG